MAWRSIFVQVVEVEVEQPRGFVGILFVEWHEAIAEVEGYGCGITLQPLVVVEATAEAVVLCLAVEVGNGYAVVGEAEERNNMIVVAFLENRICPFILSTGRMGILNYCCAKLQITRLQLLLSCYSTTDSTDGTDNHFCASISL